MKLPPHHALRASAYVTGAGPIGRYRLLVALVAATLALGLAGQLPRAATAEAGVGAAEKVRVGHTVESIVVPGSLDESRLVDVHLWYPADHKELSRSRETFYTSALNGRELPPPWTPLSWTVRAEVAREDAAIDPRGKLVPLIIFSHGNVNDPIDYAHTLELIAGAGFVVAAPYHVNNTQDDVRIDFINTQAGSQVFPCNDGLPSPCSRTDLPRSMRDRVNDIRHILDRLPDWFGERVDMSQAGVLGLPRDRHRAGRRRRQRPVGRRARAAGQGDHGHGHRHSGRHLRRQRGGRQGPDAPCRRRARRHFPTPGQRGRL
jgi:hypothetical protein